MSSRLAALALGCALASAAGAEPGPVSIRVYPHGPLSPYPLESQRHVQSLMLQNAAVLNRSAAPLTVAEIELALLRGDEAVEVRTLRGAALAELAQRGVRLAASGMREAVAFQFGDVFGDPPAKLASSPTLAPGEVLWIPNQLLDWVGERDALRITARTASPGPSTELRVPLVTASPEPRYRFPIAGRSYVQAGPTPHTHHRWAVPEEFALDIGKLGEGGLSFRGTGARFADYYAYGSPVRAAADGEVVAVVSDRREDATQIRRPDESADAYLARLQQWQATLLRSAPDALVGNYVVLRHAWGDYSLYAHLQPGSTPLAAGQRAREGDVVGRLGSSGSSTEPHLHFQICDGPGPLACAGRPAAFHDVDVPFALAPGALQSGDVVDAR
jgi:murein DD-endopeptidase MepM/ murein hydrolase activator NlpD